MLVGVGEYVTQQYTLMKFTKCCGGPNKLIPSHQYVIYCHKVALPSSVFKAPHITIMTFAGTPQLSGYIQDDCLTYFWFGNKNGFACERQLISPDFVLYGTERSSTGPIRSFELAIYS